MVVGLGLVALIYELSIWMGLSTVQWLLRKAVVYLGFGVIVLFQHEIRAVLTQLGKNIRLRVATDDASRRVRPQRLNSRNLLAVRGDGFGEHLSRTHPQTAVAILLPIDHQFFERFAVSSNTEDGVIPAFVVSVASRLDCGGAVHGG